MRVIREVSIVIVLMFSSAAIIAQDSGIGDSDNNPVENPILTQPEGRNIISCQSYGAIKYNGHTITQITSTGGVSSDIQQLWGNFTSIETIDIVGIIKYFYNDNRFSFRETELTGFTIKESNWPVTILGKNVNVGDSFSELQQKFGNGLKILKPVTSPNYSVSFNCLGNGYDGLLIYLNPLNHKVVEIVYYVNP